MNPAHRTLRDATAPAHDRVDALYGGYDLTDRASYTRFLAAHAEAFLPLEQALDAAGADRLVEDWEARKRGHLIREDLAMLGQRTADPPPPAPIQASDAWIAGTLYVLEGSRLGGKFLARQLPPGFPREYLDADQPSGNWRKLLDRLDSILYDATALQSATAAAEEAFAAFERSGERWLKD